VKKVVTNSGSVYLIDEEHRSWRKNNEPIERIWWCKAFVIDNAPNAKTWADISEAAEDRFPEVGEHLYIGARDVWYLSTPIISVEEIEDVESNS
jgi:hypothetical protein